MMPLLPANDGDLFDGEKSTFRQTWPPQAQPFKPTPSRLLDEQITFLYIEFGWFMCARPFESFVRTVVPQRRNEGAA